MQIKIPINVTKYSSYVLPCGGGHFGSGLQAERNTFCLVQLKGNEENHENMWWKEP